MITSLLQVASSLMFTDLMQLDEVNSLDTTCWQLASSLWRFLLCNKGHLSWEANNTGGSLSRDLLNFADSYKVTRAFG